MDKGVTFALFREAAMVVQGAMVLCSEPSVKDDMAPHLPPGVVLRLLKAQTPDEFCPIENDVSVFAAHFKLKEGDEEQQIDVGYKGEFEGFEEIVSHDWDVKRFRPDQIEGFEYLKEFLI
jgi:hypothetical protein